MSGRIPKGLLPLHEQTGDIDAAVMDELLSKVEDLQSTPSGPLFQQYGHGGDPEVQEYFRQRTKMIQGHFPGALGCEDFLTRCEIALNQHGFNGDNSIAMTNLCRDEITTIFRQKIDDIFSMNFSTNGLGGVLTCGKTGLGAGISHAPVCARTGKRSYVFFAFPHIAINAVGEIGEIGRPGQDVSNKACGALLGALGSIKKFGVDECAHQAGEHDPDDPEMSILMHRLARKIKAIGGADESLDLVSITKVAEQVITRDLEHLIDLAVDVVDADYAVVSGIQIHSWGEHYHDGHPNLEYVQPTSVYVVVDGVRKDIDIQKVYGPTPRQLRLLSAPTARRSEIDMMVRPTAPHLKSTARHVGQDMSRSLSMSKRGGGGGDS